MKIFYQAYQGSICFPLLCLNKSALAVGLSAVYDVHLEERVWPHSDASAAFGSMIVAWQ